ncbi:MAG: STAS domain-containing protein [Candidatus Marinimicrobia bacterium]|jgi:anti-sigma B factor antagonist|nr:STAS domain-containing protein [Candidatus Neomarinimicrobiota bacterium]
MKIIVEKSGNINIYVIESRLDSNTAGNLEKKLVPVIDAMGKKFILDFSVLDYINSAGLFVLLQAVKKIDQIGHTIVLCSIKDEVKKVFDIAGLSPIFPTYIDQEDVIYNIK